MEVVVRTTSGEAEITLGDRLGAATVATLVERVTGQPAPPLVYVDGRAEPSSTFLGDSPVRNGSVIDTREPPPDPPPDGIVELLQVAGRGAGARQWLGPGQYRLGPGRKVNAPELANAPVERSVVDLDIETNGAVMLLGRDSTARLDGAPLPDDATSIWNGEWLDVAGRVFTFRRRADLPKRPLRPEPSATTGRAIFNRPPRRQPEPPPPALILPAAEATGGGVSSALRDFATRVHERRLDERRRLRGLRHHMATAVELALTGSPQLWRVRPSHADAFHIPVAIADIPDVPTYERQGPPLPAAEALVRDPGALNLVPVVVDLSAEQGIGVVGDIDDSVAAARGILLQAAVEIGPADLDIVVATSTDRRHAWEWVKWLPHAQVAGQPSILTTPDQVANWVATTTEAAATRRSSSHLTLVVIDELEWWRDRDAPLRDVLRSPDLPLRYLILGRDASEVPAACTTIIATSSIGTGVVDHVAQGRRLERAFLFQVAADLTTDAARALAALDDPDIPETVLSPLPVNVPLLPLLGMSSLDDVDKLPVDRELRTRADDHPLAAPIGVGADGTVLLDLTPAGRSVLVAGRRGAGTSELIRSIVLSLAMQHPPNDVQFVLIDGVGGATFRHVARLPHVVGHVDGATDHHARRAIRSVRAELERRRASTDSAALPRLVLVVHEIAAVLEIEAIAAELHEVIEEGRTLGVHLVASSRRAASFMFPEPPLEFDVRVALRVDDPADSFAVINAPDAAALPGIVGRGLLAVDADQPVEFQAATVITEPTDPTDEAFSASRLDVVPFVLGRELTSMERRLLWGRDERAAHSINPDVNSLVSALGDLDKPARDPVVLPPLPGRVEFARFLEQHPGEGVPYALSDRPDEQAQVPLWWSPQQSMMVTAAGGAGVTSLFVSLMLGAANRYSPNDAHLYVVAAEPQWFAVLAPLPQVGGVIGTDDPERVVRLLCWLEQTIEERRATPAPADAAGIVVVLDDVEEIVAALRPVPDVDDAAAWVQRLCDDAADVGISIVMSSTTPSGGISLHADDATRVVMRLADDFALAAAGIDGLRPHFVPGRLILADGEIEAQAVAPPSPLHGAVASLLTHDYGPIERPPHRIELTVERPSSTMLLRTAGGGTQNAGAVVERVDDVLRLAVGINRTTLRPTVVSLEPGRPLLLVGDTAPMLSGILVALAELASADDTASVFALRAEDSPLATAASVAAHADTADLREWLRQLRSATGTKLVLVDGAARFSHPGLAELLLEQPDGTYLVVAGSGRELGSPLHWLRQLPSPRNGILLVADESDAELFGMHVPDGLVPGGATRTFSAPLRHDSTFLVDDGRWHTLAPVRPHTIGEDD